MDIPENERFMVTYTGPAETRPGNIDSVVFCEDQDEAREAVRMMGGGHLAKVWEWNGSEYQQAL